MWIHSMKDTQQITMERSLYATDLHLPTLPYYLFSNNYKSLDDIEKGAKLVIAVPNDGSNLPRALSLCADAGLINIG